MRWSRPVALALGDHVLEIGCGKAELLVRLLTRWPGATAEGFDRNPWFLADGWAAAEAARADVTRRLSLIETDAPAVLIADRGVTMTVAMGATGVYDGNQAATIAGLARATRPGGLVVFGDGLWIREPLASGLRAFGMARDELADGVDGFAALGIEAGLEVEDVAVVSDAEWDAYETAYADAITTWAAAQPRRPGPRRVPGSQRDDGRVVPRLATGCVRVRHRPVPRPGPADQAEMTPTMISSRRARASGLTTPAASSSCSASSR